MAPDTFVGLALALVWVGLVVSTWPSTAAAWTREDPDA